MEELKPQTPEADTSFLTRVVEIFLRGDVAIMIIVMAIAIGFIDLWLLPREEEPQIVVPMADIMVSAPGLTPNEVDERVAKRLEKLLNQIDGVEYVYAMSRPGGCVLTVRFYVGEDREASLVKLYTKLEANLDKVPPSVQSWVVKPVEIDDVPIVIATLYSQDPEHYGDHELRRIAEEIQHELQAIQDSNRVTVVGGRARRVRVILDPQQLASRNTSILQVARSLRASNFEMRAGAFDQQDREWQVDAGIFVQDARELEELVVNVHEGRPVYLRDVAEVIDGPEEPRSYTWIGFGPAAPRDQRTLVERYDLGVLPAVHIAVAKRKGANAVWVAARVKRRLRELRQTHLPDGVDCLLTRDYGLTANEKVGELVEGLVVAVLTVVGLIGVVIGWRPAIVIAIAIPVCYAFTLFFNLLVGYTINRVTMFALILALGLLVDDPITDVENIARYFAMRVLPPRESVLKAIQEVRPALILSTLAVIASFLPLSFITGMMGPYMAPMALNVPLTVVLSTFVAFLVTPWLAMVALRGSYGRQEEPYDVTRSPLYRLTRFLLGPILDRRWAAVAVLGGVLAVLLLAMILPLYRAVPLKMLPYDNKNEFQIVIDMPEGTTLEKTDAVARRFGDFLRTVREVRDYEVYVGTASPMDFNGMVRHYYLRQASHLADIRVNLVHKDHRKQQSHEIILRLRQPLEEIARQYGATIKIVEVPPGPPVIATITAEIYGPPDATYAELVDVARQVKQRMAREPGVVDVDTSGEEERDRWVFITDKPIAALSGVSTEQIAQTLRAALDGDLVSVLHIPGEVNPLWIEIRLPRAMRSAVDDLEEIYVIGADGKRVQLQALGHFERRPESQPVYRKNLQRVAYVFGEVAGRPPADAILDMELDRVEAGKPLPKRAPRDYRKRTWLRPGGGDPWQVPRGYRVVWNGEGEWKITLDVFRDLGLAFGAALLGIYAILMFQTGSVIMPLLIMLAIPLTLIGILPGFWGLNLMFGETIGGYDHVTFFTATAMIGMIALSGIVVRNSVVLIDFIQAAVDEGMALREAIIRSVAIRTRPIMLTAGTTLLANWVITLDPVFSGLAWAIIFGILTSTLFTIVVVPTVYWLLFQKTWEGERTSEGGRAETEA